MHFQKSTNGWTLALLQMPDYSVLKGFDAGLLRDGKLKWAEAGRDPKKLITVLRHSDFTTAPRNATWLEAKAHIRKQFYNFVDGTYLREYAAFVDVVSEANEYWTDTTWTDSDKGAGVKQHFRAVWTVWNDEFRGKTVTNPNDGGTGFIPADCRVALGAVTVSFKFPRDMLAEVVASDNVADMHCYMQCSNGVRVANDWRDHSGLFDVQEQETGLRPRWLFGESGPYLNTDFGWRHPSCLNANEDALVLNMKAWWNDLSKTSAYQQGRLLGAGCWFTSGHVGWQYYQLETPQLIKLADALRPIWKPGDDIVDKNKVLDECDEIDMHVANIRAEVLSPVPFKVKADNPCNLYDKPNGAVIRVLTDSRMMDVFQVQGTWLRVTNAPTIYWCKLSEVTLV